MLTCIRQASTVTLFLCMIGQLSAADDAPDLEAIAKRAKAATALVEVKKTSYGSGFCVHSSGLFVTNEHVVRQGSEAVNLVLNAGLKNQKVLKTKVLRRDKDLDLALLKVDGGEKFEALELGSDKDLSELKELIAFGFPFGTALARQGEYPAITVNAGHVTSLRRDKNSELDRIQLDCALNPGNSGGPVLDRAGKVVGVVVSGIHGTEVNLAIPVSHLQRFLAAPEIVLTLPAVKAANRHDAFEFTAKAIPIMDSKAAFELELVLAAGRGKERRFPMKITDGLYRARAVPFPARDALSLCEVEVKYDGGLVSGTTEDRTIHLGDNEIKLSQIRNLRLGPKPEALLSNGQRREGKLIGLETLPVKVGAQLLKLELANAEELNVETLEEATALSCSVVARQGTHEFASVSLPLAIEGVSQPSPRSDWTMDLKNMKLPDTPLAGKISGADFKPDKVELQNTMLSLRSGNDAIFIFLTLKPGQDMYEFAADAPQTKFRPRVQTNILSTKPPGVKIYTTGYAMRLQFGKEKDGKIPGKLYLCLPDDHKSFIAGSFSFSTE